MSWKNNVISPTRGLDYGVLYLIVNNEPEVTLRMSFNAILQSCEGVRKNDPFAVVYVRNDNGVWYKGEHCYSNERYKFAPVGMAAVPDVILMMELVKP